MNFKNEKIWEGYVERLVDAEVSAIAFGIGQPHKMLPRGLVVSAEKAGLPILSVPRDVSFLQVQQAITLTLASERYWLSRRAWAMASNCIALASRHSSLEQIIENIESRGSRPIAILDEFGEHFIGSYRGGTRNTQELEVSIGGESTWKLVVPEVAVEVARAFYGPIMSVLSMTLSRQFESLGELEYPDIGHYVSENSPEALAGLSSALDQAKLDIARGVSMARIVSTSTVRQNLLIQRIHHGSKAEFNLAGFQRQGGGFILFSPRSSVDSELVSNQFDRVIESEGGDCVQLVGPSYSASEVIFNFQRLASTPVTKGIRRVPNLNLESIAQLVPATIRSTAGKSVLRPLLVMPDSERHIDALQALVSSKNQTEAASLLGVHRNTLQKERLLLESKLHIDFSRPNDVALCAIALLLMRSS